MVALTCMQFSRRQLGLSAAGSRAQPSPAKLRGLRVVSGDAGGWILEQGE